MKAYPLLSVIMPAYNAERYIEASIQSVLDQTFGDFELIICDDNSTDNTKDIILDFLDSRIRFIENKSNIGYLKTVNRLFSMCQGEYIAFQDADDVSHPKRFELQLDILSQDESLYLVGTNYSRIDSRSRILSVHDACCEPDLIKKLIIENNQFQKPSIIFRKHILQTVGGYREAFLQLGNISEDYDWLLRICERYKVININYQEPLYIYRTLSTSMSRDIKDAKQFYGHKVAQYLAKQRISGEKDYIEQGRISELQELIEEWTILYKKDDSLFYFDLSKNFLNTKDYFRAVGWALRSVMHDPFNMGKYYHIGSCIKNGIIREVFGKL